MVKNQTSQGSLIPALFAGIAGILCVFVVPLITMRAMDTIISGALIKIEASGNPLLASAPKIVISFFPVWGGLSTAAGIALIFVAWAIYQGKSWARPAAVGLLAIPSITGAYFSGPIMFFASSRAYYFLIVALIGLIPYFVILLWDKAPAGEKVGCFFLFLMLGVTAAWSFSNGGSSLRMFWARPEPYVLNSGHFGFLMGIPVVWIGVICVIVSIPFLAAKTRFGYYMAVVGLPIILVGSAILRITHPTTTEFLVGIIMALVSLVLLWLPAVGRQLMPQAEPAMA